MHAKLQTDGLPTQPCSSCMHQGLWLSNVTRSVQQAVEAFLEEVVVRRELSDNYCHYEPNYDNIRGAAQWAQDSLEKHRTDPREYLYTL